MFYLKREEDGRGEKETEAEVEGEKERGEAGGREMEIGGR